MENLVKKNGQSIYCLPYNKVFKGASKKQLDYLLSFDNVGWLDGSISTSQLMKRMSSDDASDLIDLAKSGEEIKIEG